MSYHLKEEEERKSETFKVVGRLQTLDVWLLENV